MMVTMFIFPGYSQDKSSESSKSSGLKKINTNSHSKDIRVHIDEEELNATIESAVENAMQAIDVAMKNLDIQLSNLEIKFNDMDIKIDPINIRIPDINIDIDPVDIDLDDLDIDVDVRHKDFNWNEDEDYIHRKHELIEDKEKDKLKDKSDNKDEKTDKEKDKTKGLKKIN
jgi:hypothetical protein